LREDGKEQTERRVAENNLAADASRAAVESLKSNCMAGRARFETHPGGAGSLRSMTYIIDGMRKSPHPEEAAERLSRRTHCRLSSSTRNSFTGFATLLQAEVSRLRMVRISVMFEPMREPRVGRKTFTTGLTGAI
jgi:hypothetical protein